MGSASRHHIVTALAAVTNEEVEPGLCNTSAGLVGVTGAAIVVVTDGGHRAVLCSSNPTASALEDLQTTLGEGPGIDAYRRGMPVVDADLAGPARSQWLAFAPPAVQAGAAAVYAFPLRVGAVRLGTVTFSHAQPGRLTDEQYADARAVANAVTQVVLGIQSKAPPGMVAWPLAAASDGGVEVHQATGVLAVRLGVTVGEAMIRLRALAYSEERPLAEVARDVIAGKLGSG